MKTSSEKYQLLEEEESDGAFPQCESSDSNFPQRSKKLVMILRGILVLSVGFNIVAIIQYFRHQNLLLSADGSGPSLFAGLTYDTLVMRDHNGLYNSLNETLTDAAWEDINYDLGNTAPDNEYAKSKGLPPAQKFPWDESKSIYFLNAYHALHCLKIMRFTMRELQQGLQPTYPLEHTFHCFNAIRQDIICTADDSPRKTSWDHPGVIGVGQVQLCRSWNKLEQFAKDHTACWRDINSLDQVDTLKRYRYCPKGSPYNERIHAIFGDFETGKNATAFD